MNFQKILKQVAIENNTTPEDVYREMQIALADAYSHKDDTQESQALWKEMGFDKRCPSPEQFIKKSAQKLRGDLGMSRLRRAVRCGLRGDLPRVYGFFALLGVYP